MYIGVVIGTVVATRQTEGLKGIKFLVVQPLSHDNKPKGDAVVAVDTVRACQGDRVYLVSAREASQALEDWFVPVDAAIVGIIDHIDLEEFKF